VRNVVLLIYRGSIVWFQSINEEVDVIRVYYYIDRLLANGRFIPPDGPLAAKVFQRFVSGEYQQQTQIASTEGASSCPNIISTSTSSQR
jgi:hypothetical protein